MFRGLVGAGVAVRVTNPIGPLKLNYPARNHKKLIIADDVAYVGGINFSDHNFAWRDFMVRIAGQEAADFLAADFDATWAGTPRPAAASLDGLRLLSLDGRDPTTRFFRRGGGDADRGRAARDRGDERLSDLSPSPPPWPPPPGAVSRCG